MQAYMGGSDTDKIPAARVIEAQQKAAPENICIPYSETRYQRFHRLGELFREGSPTYCVNPITQVGMHDGLLMYRYGMQGAYGDNKGQRPGVFAPIARAKYDSWMEAKGMKRETA